MSDLHLFHGPNAGYALELLDRYRKDPTSVDPETRAFFDNNPIDADTELSATPTVGAAPQSAAPASGRDEPETIRIAAAAARLARFIRQRGHIAAHVDPLGLTPPGYAGLELQEHKLTARALEALPSSVVGGPIARETNNAREALERLRQVYSGTIGYDDEHIENSEERYWLRDSTESGAFLPRLTPEQKQDLLERLTEVETFERFIHSTFKGSKRFSIEGTDMLVPILDEIICQAAENGTRDVVMGMAHRGRLNVLAHVLGKPYANILVGFETQQSQDESASVAGRSGRGYPGDVKYHLGFRRAYKESGIREMPITLVPNPSHLEFVNPVVEGYTRAAQEQRSHPGPPTLDVRYALPIAIHGDAAFPGQGVVAETLNMTNLAGYRTGGTIHIIVNNQIGFTTLPSDGRSTRYASDLAKGFEIPIVHVNADDPLACIAAARMAVAYRERFHKDFLIDLIGYRRYGHNEGDAPELTQPRMYETIEAHPSVRELFADQLLKEGIVSEEQASSMISTVRERLMAARKQLPSDTGVHDPVALPASQRVVSTAVPADKLIALNTALLTWPEGLQVNPKLERVFNRWRGGLQAEGGIEWGQAEALAFASILTEGTPIRLTGQDSERGTFGHRNQVLHDTVTGERFVPLQALPGARAAYAVYNSPLSENAAVGFEYGYCINAKEVLTLWEGQFGDFANGAQVIIDQFLTSGSAKWNQTPSLVMLLPHGYEGSGPEHSSARLERFLQLAANNNIRIANCTSSAQYFHLLRRQAALLESDPRPLIVMTPKSLLRHPRAGSSLIDLTEGSFQTVIDDAVAQQRADEVTRLVLCSGKVYIDLAGTDAFATADRIAVARIEQLYPFPADEIKRVIAGYPNLRELVWLQEEPQNMGAWNFVAPRLRDLADWHGELRYVGRAEAASPAEGSMAAHTLEQNHLLATALQDAPEISPASSAVEDWGLGAGHARK
ncbi:MAG: 2-oxoglutarate dehydrogenase, subunit [Chthonomonadaceae bacterium]|nr:2-oxoglutarate dehydrogenase, subunit [Chthonomonadaceae bacterium]